MWGVVSWFFDSSNVVLGWLTFLDNFGRNFVIDESIEMLNALNVLWLRHLSDYLYFGRIRLQALVHQEMCHEGDFAHPQLHLVWIKDKASVFAPLKEILEAPIVVCGCFFIAFSSAIDEDINSDAQNTR